MGWLRELLEALLDKLIAFYAGAKAVEAHSLKSDLDRVEEAMRASAVNSALSVDERLLDAKKRGLYRISGEKADD